MAAPIFSEGDESTNEERLNYMYLNLVGQTVIAHTADGAKVEGLFVSADDDSGDVILGKARYKTSKIHKGKDNANFSDRLLIPAGSLMMIEAVEVNFRTQGVARGNVDHLRRGMEPMTKWSEVTDDPGEGLEEEPHRPGQWDQFKANKEKFGVQSTYVEEEYTTKLDKSKMTRKQHVEAERIEREIMNAAVKGVQHQIERGGDGEGQYDEGELFSDVLPSDKKGGGGGRRGGDAAPPPPPKVTEGAPAAKSGGPPGSRYIPPAERKRLEAAGQWPPKDADGGSSPTDQAEPPQLTTTAKNAPSHIDPAIVADTSNNNATGAQADSAPNSQQKGQLNPGARAFTPGVSLAAHDTQLAPPVSDQKPKAASSDKAKPSSSAPTTAASATGASAKAGFFVSDMLGSIASVLQRRLDAGEFSAPQPTYEWQGDEAFTSDANSAAFMPQHGGPHAHHGGGLSHHHHGGHPHGMHGGGGFAQQNMMMGGGPHAHHNVHHSHHGGHHHHGGGHGMHGGGFQGGMGGGGGGFGGQGGYQGYDQQGGQFAGGGGHQNFNNFGDQFAGGGQPGFGGAAFSNSNPHHHQGGGFSGGGNFAGGSGGFTSSPNSTQQHQHHHAHQYSQQQQMMGGGGGGFGGQQGGAGSSSTTGGGGFGRGGGGMGRGGGGHAQPQQPVSSGMMEPPATGGGGNGSGGGSPTIPRPASESRGGGGGMAPRGGGMRGRGRGAGGGGSAQDEQPHQPQQQQQQQQQGNNNGTLIGANVATNKPKRGGR